MANSGQPTIATGATGDAVRWLQRALRRTPDLGLAVDGIFGPMTDQAVRQFQQANSLTVDGVVGPLTWAALPDGAPMPVLQIGSNGPVVAGLQTVLANGSSQGWPSPGAADADFGPLTQASVEGFQNWAGITADGIVGDQTWSVSLHAMSATLESAVGLQYVID
jgi:peptidoglycan hydrolase-like protein with peptidoglycan-binding domain